LMFNGNIVYRRVVLDGEQKKNQGFKLFSIWVVN